MIANTRVVTVDVRLSALSRQSIRLVFETLADEGGFDATPSPTQTNVNSRPLSQFVPVGRKRLDTVVAVTVIPMMSLFLAA
jgi:hypothetical protein